MSLGAPADVGIVEFGGYHHPLLPQCALVDGEKISRVN